METGIIKSILDSDLYKFSMQNWVIQHYPEANVIHTFNNRDKLMIFTEESVKEIKRQIELMQYLRLENNEYDWLKKNLYFLPASYRQYLAAYRYNPSQVHIIFNNGELDIIIKGKWRDTILWEVPVMSIISEVYFKMVDTDITKEEMDTMAANNIEPKDVNKYVSSKVREMFFKLA